MANPETCGNIGYKNGQSRDMWQHWVQEWPIQRHVATLGTRMANPETCGNIGHTRHRTKREQKVVVF
jgi:hypothetical protein